ncbi:uncharacterized protein I303_104969 [Kwoniella dejecticola CBS 10117]|uniref:Uncharacterized protein n=1 Tax=Kwoniella dejecticola CBS 10117 TaxID=1296121 RepID=A0A1A6A3U6_9TREE|nr:uncharacterized protein I303_05586 [Kwoniella dejecticola CBS 10117]OBR84727.1 hypothetical protein I303_05586 [Kwoniella dejecticola CBS 10117]
MAAARQRTAAQRKQKGEVEEPLRADEILDNDGQEDQIRLLREKNTADNKQAHLALDLGVLISSIISILQFFDHLSSPNPIFSILAFIQFALLPLSLTPGWIPYLPEISSENHLYSFSIQLTVSFCALFIRYYHSLPGATGVGAGLVPLELGEVARWVIPALVVGAIDLQRRSEKQSEENLNQLENLKYDLKGA